MEARIMARGWFTCLRSTGSSMRHHKNNIMRLDMLLLRKAIGEISRGDCNTSGASRRTIGRT